VGKRRGRGGRTFKRSCLLRGSAEEDAYMARGSAKEIGPKTVCGGAGGRGVEPLGGHNKCLEKMQEVLGGELISPSKRFLERLLGGEFDRLRDIRR